MIPRHQPAYRWLDWARALLATRSPERLAAELAARLGERLGRRHALFYNRGRDAIYAYCAVAAPGRPAIVPAFTCCVVPEAIRNAGNPLLFADIDASTLNLEPAGLAGLVLPPPGAVLVLTHQWGLPCQAEALMRWADEHQVRVLEDCASALGAGVDGCPCGSFGESAVLSFENTKLLGSGRLGVLVTDNDALAGRLREDQRTFLPPVSAAKQTALLKLINTPALYRATFGLWSRREGDVYSDHGEQATRPAAYYRQRPHLFQLALLLAQWDDLERRRAHRARLAEVYAECFADLPPEATYRPNPGARPSLIRQPIRAPRKRAFYDAMFRAGYDLGWSFAYTVAPAGEESHYPVAARVARQILNLPIHEGVNPEQARRIAGVARRLLIETGD